MNEYVSARARRRGRVTRMLRAAGRRVPGREAVPAGPAGGRVVVVGGSIAGTLAARVLSESYREVIVVDRDEVVGVSGARKGAPHSIHAHSLHARGYLIMAELFPNLLEEARALGLPVRDFGGMRWYFDARPARTADTGLLSIAGNRPMLEEYLRSRVAALPNVTYRQRTEMLGLQTSPDRSQVTGVRLRERRADAVEYLLDAELVVDATGRGSRTPALLAELGYQRPPEERMKIGLAYTTRTYRMRPGTSWSPGATNPLASPAHPRGAFFGLTPAGDCRLSLTGVLNDHPPTDPQGFEEFVRSLPVPDIYAAVSDADPTSDAVSFKFPANVWRHYERLTRFPGGLIVLGDAVCSFNPVYGQGMTVAAMQAMALRARLRRRSPLDPLAVMRDFARVIRIPWFVSTSGDLNFPGVTGPRTAKVRLHNALLARVQYAATKDPAATTALMRIMGLIDPPGALWRPRLLARVLWLSRDMPASPRRVGAPVVPAQAWTDAAADRANAA